MNESDFELLKQERNQAMRIANSNAIAYVELEGKCEEYLDKIARLEAECAALRESLTAEQNYSDAARDSICRLKGDSEKYCWIKNYRNLFRIASMLDSDEFGTVDDAVDAAMQAGEKP